MWYSPAAGPLSALLPLNGLLFRAGARHGLNLLDAGGGEGAFPPLLWLLVAAGGATIPGTKINPFVVATMFEMSCYQPIHVQA